MKTDPQDPFLPPLSSHISLVMTDLNVISLAHWLPGASHRLPIREIIVTLRESGR